MTMYHSGSGRVWLAAVLVGSLLAPGIGRAWAREGNSPPVRGVTQTDNPRVSISFKDTEMRDVLAILAYKSGVNIVAGDDVTGKVSVQLADVPWEQALDIILKTYNFTYRREDRIVRVMSLQRAIEEEDKSPLVTRIVPLNFAEVESLRESLGKMLTRRGSISIDKRTNVLIVTDIPENVEAIERASVKLDTLTPQVMIEALMVDVKLTDEERWGSLLDILDVSSGNEYAHDLMGGSEAGTLSIAGIFKGLDIRSRIGFMVSQNKAQILANPKVLTLDNQEAKIEIIEEIPYTESVDSGSGVTTNVRFKQAGVKLFVTPHITSGNYISMNVRPEQSFKSGELGNQPIIDSRKAETNLLVKNGQTIVIGGLRKISDAVTYEKIPLLGDIPALGWLFRKKVTSVVESELMLFVTPRIVTASEFSSGEQEILHELQARSAPRLTGKTESHIYPDMRAKLREWFRAEKIADEEVTRRRVEKESTQEQHAAPEREVPAQPSARVSAPPAVEKPAEESSAFLRHQYLLDNEAEQLKAALQQLK